MGSFPMQCFPVFEIIEKARCYKNWALFDSLGVSSLKRLVCRAVVVIFCAILATTVPKFGLFLNLLGAFSGTALAFVVPITIYDRVFKEEITTIRKLAHMMLNIFGVVVGAIACSISIFELMAAFGEHEKLITLSDSQVVSNSTMSEMAKNETRLPL